MSEPSLEYNLGTIGFVDLIDTTLLAYEDGRALFCMAFHSPGNKRLKPVLLLLTDYTFSEFCKLLVEVETQIEKLLTTNRISSVSLPQTSEVAFRSNLGSVDYSTCSLSVSVVVMKEGTAFLQLYAQDSKSRSNGFASMFDDQEFGKLKNVVKEAFNTIIKPKPQVRSDHSERSANQEVRNQKFVIVSERGSVSIDVKNSAEAQMAVKEIGLIKKEIVLNKRDVEEKIRQIRADYTDQKRRRGSKIRGSGWFGSVVRVFQTAESDSQRYKLSAELQPLENQKRYLEGLISTLNRHLLELEKVLFEKS